MLIGLESIIGFILMTIIGCIAVIMAVLAGLVIYKWMNSSSPSNLSEPQQSVENKYQHVANHHIDQL